MSVGEIEYQPDISVPLDGAEPSVPTGSAEPAAEASGADAASRPDGDGSPDYIEIEVDAEPPASDTDDAPVAEAAPEPAEDIAALRAEAARARQWDEYAAHQQRLSQQRAAEAQWARQEQEADAYYNAAIAQAVRASHDALDPDAYWRQNGAPLMQQQQAWHRQFEQSKAQRWQEVAAVMALPQYAAQVAQQAGLAQDAAAELLNYHPDQMEREAARMRRDRDEKAALKRQATQRRRQELASELAGNTVSPGTGRPGTRRVEAGSDDHYNSLPSFRR